MNQQTAKLFEDALKLPPELRAALAGSLIESLDHQIDEDAEAAWADEIARRLEDLDSGRVKGIPWPAARKAIHGDSDGDD